MNLPDLFMTRCCIIRCATRTRPFSLLDVVIDENKLNAIKAYRHQSRDFMNKLINDEIECNLIDDDFDEKYFPKVMLDGTAEQTQKDCILIRGVVVLFITNPKSSLL